MKEIILNPRAWAEKVAEREVLKNLGKYKDAKVLGEKFAKEISGD